jgi:hypothetical protein
LRTSAETTPQQTPSFRRHGKNHLPRYAIHIKGLSNVVPDLLSDDGTHDGKRHPLAYDHPSDAVLTQRFYSHLPSQIPESFTISPLPDEISSWVCRVLQVAAASSLTANKKQHLKMSTGAGDGGQASLPEPISSRPLPPCPTPTRHRARRPSISLLLLPYDKYYLSHIKINKVRAARYNIMRCNKFITTHQNSSSDAICAIYVDGCPRSITQEFLRNQLRMTCQLGGGKEAFGFDPHEIGTKSIRSGAAAMPLFLMDHHPHKIMILGRWSLEAFLVYIRPQVLEWTNNMGHDMIRFDSFTDITRTSDTAGNVSWLAPQAFNGPVSILVPKLHLLH